MTQLLIQGSAILAQGPFVETESEITCSDAIYPKHVIPGWQVVDVDLPQGFAPFLYVWENNALVAAPPSAEELATAKSSQAESIAATCKAAIVAGFTSSALGSLHTYPAKPIDQQNLNASVVASLLSNPAGWTTPFWCADSNGTWALVPHTAAQIQQAGVDGKVAIQSLIEKNSSLANQIAACTTIAAVRAIVWA